MFNIEELKDDLLVEEGHYLERIQNEALEEGFLYATIRDIESLIKEYGVGYVGSLFDKETLVALRTYLNAN
jgi:hypothetical protein